MIVVVVVMVMEQQLLLMFLRHPRLVQLALEGDERKQVVAQVIMAGQGTFDDRVGVRVILVVANRHGHTGGVQTTGEEISLCRKNKDETSSRDISSTEL